MRKMEHKYKDTRIKDEIETHNDDITRQITIARKGISQLYQNIREDQKNTDHYIKKIRIFEKRIEELENNYKE